MRKFIYLLMALFTLAMSSCSFEKKQADLFTETQSGSVMISNKFYYQLTIPDGTVLYFTGLDEDGDLENLTSDVKEIEKNCKFVTGTGFFVDKDGSIITNRHVVNQDLTDAQIKKAYRSFVDAITTYLTYMRSQVSDQYDQLESEKSDCYYYNGYGYTADQEKLAEIISQQQTLASQFQEMGETLNDLANISDPDQIKVKTISEIGIAYNDTYVTGEKDLIEKNPCVVIRTSGDQDVDLALIQLKDKKTPEGKYIFTTAERRSKGFSEKILDKYDGTLTMGQQLYMIGYNAGPTLANTKTGIKVQMTSGKVTQLSDGQRILYDIATVAGSSGSPVIDTRGNLVAVNFAKLNGSDNFNFGIPVEKVKEFMKW